MKINLVILTILSLIASASTACTKGNYDAPGRRRLIKTETSIAYLTDKQVEELVRDGIKFMDISYGGELSTLQAPQRPHIPTFSSSSSLINEIKSIIHSNVEIGRMKHLLEGLTSFRNRFYQASTGREASEWVYQTLHDLTNDSPMKVTIQRLVHPHWPQFSVRCRIDAPGITEATRERVILSAHLDSTAMFAPMWMPAPGADDGSGVVTQLETIAILASYQWNLFRPIEFIFFAAEEGGLLGSQNVVRYYQEEGIPAALLHIDMDGYVKRGGLPGIGLLTDNTDPQLNSLLKQIITTYSTFPIKETTCGYACSDHYSWHLGGYPAAALFEGTMEEINPHIHRSSDTVQYIDFEHMSEFVKVAFAFALHMAVKQPDDSIELA